MPTPQTGFEQTGTWTTLARETEFLQQVTAETDAVLTEAGRTVQGRPIHRIDLGTGIAQTMLIACLQHGNEQASREGALMQIRDLAYSTDPAVAAYLAAHRIVWITNLNSDRFPTARVNANNFNLNRDHYRLSQPETDAVTTAISETSPHLIIDAHEFFASSSTTWMGRANGLPGTHPQIQALGDTLNEDCKGLIRDQGKTATDYALSVTARAFLSCAAGVHHAVGMLSETNANHDTPADRVAIQRLILGNIRDWHEANAVACTQARAASRQWSISHTGQDSFTVRTEFIPDDTVQTVRIAGYQLSTPLPQKHIDTFGIDVSPDGFVTMNQPARLVIPQLLDPASMDKQAEAVRVPRPPEPDPPVPLPDGVLAGMRVQVDGRPRPVIQVRHRTGGQTHVVDL